MTENPHQTLPTQVVDELALMPSDPVLDRAGKREPTGAYLRERYLEFVKRKWWLVILSTAACLVPAIAYIGWWPESYAATARMWVAGRISLQDGSVYEEQPMTFAETQVGLIESDTVRHRALARLRAMPDLNLPASLNDKELPFSLRVTQIRNGGLLELRGKGPGADAVCTYLNAVMDEFLLYKKEARVATSGDTYATLANDITKQQTEVKNEQDKLAAYSRDRNVIVQEQQAQAASTYLSQLMTDLSQLKIESELADRDLEQAQLLSISGTNISTFVVGTGGLDSLGTSTLSLTDYVAAQEELQKFNLARAKLSRDLRPQHPKIVKLDEEIARSEEQSAYLGQLARERLAALRQNLATRMDVLQKTIKDWEAKVGTASERIAEYQRLKVNVERAQTVQDRLLNLLQSVDMGMNLNSQTVAILDRAAEAKPTKLAAPAVLGLAIFLGLGLGSALIMLGQRFSDLVISTEDLRLRFDEWIIGQVPELPDGEAHLGQDLPTARIDHEGFGESFRNLRSALFFGLEPRERRKVLLVTSATPDEGKSTVATNLARALASASSRVLLIDGDLRCGKLHENFRVQPVEGLAEFLTLGGNPAQFIRPTTTANLFFLPRGRADIAAGELFVGSNFDLLMDAVRRQFDYVIIDSIPIFAADDATSVAPKTDGVLFVVRGSYVGAGAVHRALEQLYERRATVLGLVLNRVNCASRFYHYNKYDKYHLQTPVGRVAREVLVDG